jgi:nucleoside-diphosphate-sugar epimerase
VAGHEVLIHTAFEGSARGPAVDRAVVDTMIAAARRAEAAGTRTTIIYTSGIWVLGKCEQAAAEDAPVAPVPLVAWRPEHEQAILSAASPLIRTAVVRPGIVFGGSRGIIGDMLRDAANGIVRVVGSGQNRWPLVYLRDLAELYGLLATHSDGSGIFHATDDSESRVIDIVEAVADHMKHRPDVRHIPIEEARTKMGPFADALALDQIVKSPRARALGWTPAFKRFTANVSNVFEEWRRGRESSAQSE